MATTVSQIMADVQARGFEVDTATQQLAFVNQVQRKIFADHRWDFLLTTLTPAVTPAVSGVFTYTYPSTVQNIESVRFASSNVAGGQPELEYRDPEDFLATVAYEGTAVGFITPLIWTIASPGVISIWPAFQAAGTLTVRGLLKHVLLTSGSDNVQVPDEYVDVIVVGVCELLSARERQIYVTQGWQAEYADRLQSMKVQHGLKQRQTSPRVVSTGRFTTPYDTDGGWGY